MAPGSASSVVKLKAAVLHHQAGRLAEAKQLYAEILSREPKNVVALHFLGVIADQEGDARKAIALIGKAIALQPDFAEAHNNLGVALKNHGKLDKAVAAYRKALELKPDFAEAYKNLAVALKNKGMLSDAVAACRKVLEANPGDANAYNNLGSVLNDQGELDEAAAAFRKALDLKPDHAKAHSNLLLCMNYQTQASQQEIFAMSRRWGEVHGAPSAASERPAPSDPDPDRPLRVGYVSPDFREHSVSYFLEPVIAGHDRRSFEIFCYAEVAKQDDKTARYRGLSDGWCSTVGMTDLAVADRIREDGIDILVDLAGHTANSRLLVFAERLAPVQVTWCGYPNTTGLRTMDYRLTDAIADPEGDSDALHSETLLRLPNGFLSYGPAADAPEVNELPALTAGQVTFGSFNNLAKVTPNVVETWAQILSRVPASRLVIKSLPLADETVRERYLEMFAAQGIDAGRVELLSRIAARSGHLGAYNRIDIGLDPFPYNGTTTTFEALWMGVPVITLRGDRHAGRVGTSILTRVELADLVAETEAAYVETAVELANDLDRLAALRSDVRSRMRMSPLCDAQAFVRDLELAYREMWRRVCA